MVQLENLRFGYGRETLFENLNLSLKSGSIYGLLGRNGAGKTSLLRIIAGQLYRWSGTCEVKGQDPSKRRPSCLADIYFLPEEFYTPSLKIEQYVSTIAPFYPRFDYARFSEYVREFEIPVTKRLSAFSYGQKKKILLAFGLSTGCSLILLDEPTNGLDIPSKGQFRRLIASALTEDQTFLISTHQVRDMANLIDPIIILDNGSILFNRSLEQVQEQVSIHVQREKPTDALYSEKGLGGYSVINRRSESIDSEIDLELLFNAVVEKNSALVELFTPGGEI